MYQNLITITALCLAAAPAVAHLHVSIAATGGELSIVTYGSTSTFAGADGLMIRPNGDPHEFPLNFGPLTSGPFEGFVTGPAPTLTSDFYRSASFDPTVGARLFYELAGVFAPDGSAAQTVIGFTIPASEGGYQEARTGGDLEGRLLDYGHNFHPHGVSFFADRGGTWDLALVAHDLRDDVSARLASSEPVRVRVVAVPEPAVPFAGVAVAGVLLRRRR